MRKLLLFFVLLIIAQNYAFGQSAFWIKGKVLDSRGEPLIGASVVLKPMNIGAATDFEGNYQFEVPASFATGQTVELVASYVNYKKQSFSFVLNKVDITHNFELPDDVFQSEEVVVTGIASKTAKSVAEVSVARISAADLQNISAFNGFSQLVAGKVAGVQMTTNTGNVGGGWRFNVRGGGGMNGDGQPTIYVDGVRVENTEIGLAAGGQLNNTLAGINANDIEKVEFLKGPAAAAMYGTNGANGVVLITTKTGSLSKGRARGLSVDYRFNYGYNEQQKKYSSEDFLTADVANGNFRKGPIREHYFNLAGGGADLRYFASIENRLEDGLMPTNQQDRTSARVNLVAFPYDNFSIKLNAYYVKNKVLRPNNDNSIYGWLGNSLLRTVPYTWTSRVMLEQGVIDGNTNQYIGSISAMYKPISDLEINATVGLDNSDYRENRFYPIAYNPLVSTGQKTLYNRRNRQINYELNGTYNYELGDFNFRSTVGAQFFDRLFQDNFITGQGFNSTAITSFTAAATMTGWQERFLHTREGGIFTEHAISYLDQYFLTLGLRKDYATAIGDNAPSITYPKASAAVRIDKYDFLPSFIGLLKVRAAYGEGGVLPANTDGIALLWDAQTGGYGTGAAISNVGNTAIQPERVKEFEVGFDTELFNQVSLEFTYYNTVAENSIVNRQLAGSTGKYQVTTALLAQPYNLGKVSGSGFESLLQFTPIRGTEFNLDFTLIWNYQKNVIDDLGGTGDIIADPNAMTVGKPKHQFYTFIPVGVNYNPTTQKYSSARLSTEKVDLGSPIPDHTGSLAINFKFFKDFTLYAFGEWGLNNKICNQTQQFVNRLGGNAEYNRYRFLLGLSEAYPGAAPKDVTPLTPGTDEYKKVAEEFARMDGLYYGNYVEDASYFVLREISLSYDATDLLKTFDVNTYIKYLTIGVSGRNLVTVSEYSGVDVGLHYLGGRTTVSRGVDFLTLPTPRTINFWVRFGL